MAENSLRVVAHIKAKPETVEDVRAMLTGLVGPTRAEEGCVSYELLQNRSDPTDFAFVEEWASDAALESHFATDHIKAAFARAVELLDGSPDIRTYSVVK